MQLALMMAGSSPPAPTFDDRVEAMSLNMSCVHPVGRKGILGGHKRHRRAAEGSRERSVLHLQPSYNTLDSDLGIVSISASVLYACSAIKCSILSMLMCTQIITHHISSCHIHRAL